MNMPLSDVGDTKSQIGSTGPSRTPMKCRIPQRLQTVRQRTNTFKKNTNTPDHTPMNQGHRDKSPKVSRPRSFEPRPKSANRKEETIPGRQTRIGRAEVNPAGNSRVSTKATSGLDSSRRKEKRLKSNEKMCFMNIQNQHCKKSIIPKKTDGRSKTSNKKAEPLPDQDIIKMYEELEVKGEYAHVPGKEAVHSPSLFEMKSCWQEKINLFEKMRSELEEKQKDIMEVYATLRNTHKMMTTLGHQATLPAADELRIMNVAKLSPDQLLQLCTGTRLPEEIQVNGAVTIDMNKIYDMPTKLVATCEQTLIKRKEIINWFETLKNEEKGISMNKLTKKINEFNAENEMLNCSLQTCKTEFLKDLNEIIDYLRKGLNDSVALQVRVEELMYDISELNSLNTDLRKQLQSSENMRSSNNKFKVEELEKELKEERTRRTREREAMKERLARAEGQMKIGCDRASQLEAALELARSRNWTLERTMEQLNDQNQKLQSEFDKELNKLTCSIQVNVQRLEELEESRERLIVEKDTLEKRIKEITELHDNMQQSLNDQLNSIAEKYEDAEARVAEEKEEKQKLETSLECLCSQLLESEIRYKEIIKQLQEKDTQLGRALGYKNDLQMLTEDLNEARNEAETYKNRWMDQTETTKELQAQLCDALNMEKSLRSELQIKEDYIESLLDKGNTLQCQIQEGEKKMLSYQDQLNVLKNHITQLQEEFGEFEDLSQLIEIINDQRNKMAETVRQNQELLDALEKKDTAVATQEERLKALENVLQQRDNVIKMLSEKEEEQKNIVQLLRHNLEMRTQVDCDLSQQLAEKNTEIESLITNVETRKQQISQLEQIILTLEDQLRKVHAQRRRDQERMIYLEKAVADYELYHVETQNPTEPPPDNLNQLIKILEEELNNLEPKNSEPTNKTLKKKFLENRKRNTKTDVDSSDAHTVQAEHEKMPTKVAMGTFQKKSTKLYEERGENVERKKLLTNFDEQKKFSANVEGTKFKMRSEQPNEDGNILTSEPTDCYLQAKVLPVANPFSRNLRFIMNSSRDDEKKFSYIGAQRDEEKKSKMYKIASHKV